VHGLRLRMLIEGCLHVAVHLTYWLGKFALVFFLINSEIT